MIILVTNDDGIDSPGLAALAAAVTRVAPDASVWVVAPARQQSGCSHAMTMREPLRVASRSATVHSVSGTSADCVFLALYHLLPERPGLVISGINAGPNLGDDLHYSGTAGAAGEAALAGIPTLAASVAVDFDDPHRGEPAWDTAVWHIDRIVRQILRSPPAAPLYLNLNVPDTPTDQVRGLRVCRLSKRRYIPEVLHRLDGFGSPYYWISARHDGFYELPDSDGQLVEAGYATLTPVEVDLTAYSRLDEVRALVASAGLDTWQDRDVR
jgi:5'-nucleotidase